ncbi:hypothetical protein Q9L58_008706 [Maublancomyces gigas]|uniref:Uncharacterized protein n=1 Tax=Discina gigas TaxID=1032678 RepID=A0ABR3G922_9PEZI
MDYSPSYPTNRPRASKEDPIAAYQTRSILHDLVNAGADLEAVNSHGETPLLVAAMCQRAFGNMAFLISYRPCVGASDDNGHRIAFYPFKKDVPLGAVVAHTDTPGRY